jgi:hypothetical protein
LVPQSNNLSQHTRTVPEETAGDGEPKGINPSQNIIHSTKEERRKKEIKKEKKKKKTDEQATRGKKGSRKRNRTMDRVRRLNKKGISQAITTV